MPISYVNGNSANSGSVSLPSGVQVGDLCVFVGGRTSTAGPGVPSGFEDLGVVSGGSGGSAHGQRLAWRILTQADIDAGSVSASNCTECCIGIYRGASSISSKHSGNGANSSTITFPAQSGLASGSWQVAMATHRSATNVRDRSVTGYTNRSSDFAGTRTGLWDSNGTTSGIAQQTASVNASSGNVGRTFEILEATVTATRGRISWSELETPSAVARGRISWAELQVPLVPTHGRISFAELEVPITPTRGRVSWSEVEVDPAAVRGRLSWTEVEVPDVVTADPTRGLISFAELEVPLTGTRGRISWAELETPIVLTRGLISFAELEVPITMTRGRVSWSEVEVGHMPTRGRISWSEFVLPDFGMLANLYILAIMRRRRRRPK